MAERSYKYEVVAASQTDQVIGSTGAIGDSIKKIIISVGIAASGACSIKDGSGSSIPLSYATTAVGVYTVDFGNDGIIASGGAWSATTGAGATLVIIGNFS